MRWRAARRPDGESARFAGLAKKDRGGAGESRPPIFDPCVANRAVAHRGRSRCESGAAAGAGLARGLSRSRRGAFRASELTRGPWNPGHQHAGPPSALMTRAIERAAAKDSLTHLARLTVNLLRPAPIGECRVEIATDYAGRNAGHYSGRLTAEGKEVARFTALMQREEGLSVPEGTSGHPSRAAPKPPDECPVVTMAFADGTRGYGHLIENRLAAGRFFNGPCAAWFRLNHPLVEGERPSPYQRVAVAADFGQRDQRRPGLRKVDFSQLRSDDQPLPPTGGGMDLPRRAELHRRQRLRPRRIRALRRAGKDRAGDAEPRGAGALRLDALCAGYDKTVEPYSLGGISLLSLDVHVIVSEEYRRRSQLRLPIRDSYRSVERPGVNLHEARSTSPAAPRRPAAPCLPSIRGRRRPRSRHR